MRKIKLTEQDLTNIVNRVILEDEKPKKKLFVPRDIDKRKEQLKKELVGKTKELLSVFNITEIINQCRIDDYDEVITAEDHLDGLYSRVIIDGKNYHGFPQMDEKNKKLIYGWEELLATYLNTILPQPSDESIYKAEPNVIGRMFKITITPTKIDISFSYAVVEYSDKEGKETITL